MPNTPDALVRADERSRCRPPTVPALLSATLDDALGVDPDRVDGRLRRVPSAGALHPVAVYLHRRLDGYSETIRWHPQGACVPVCRRPSGHADGVDIVLVAKPETTIAKYGDRALAHVVLDVGYARSAIVHSAKARGVNPSSPKGVCLPGVSGFPLASIAVGHFLVQQRMADTVDHVGHDRGPASGPPAATDVVTQGLAQLAGSPDTSVPTTTTISISAIRSRRSAPYDLLTRPAAPESIASMLVETSPRGCPDDLEIWLSTETDLRRWNDGGFAPVATEDLRGELAEAAAQQHALAHVGALVFFTAPRAGAVTAATFLRHRLDIAHLGYGLCVRAAGRSLGARPVGGWATTMARHPWTDRGVIVHGVALGALPRSNDAGGPA